MDPIIFVIIFIGAVAWTLGLTFGVIGLVELLVRVGFISMPKENN